MKNFVVTYFCENPYPAFILGVIAVGFFAAFYNVTQKRVFLHAAGITIALVIGVFVTERLIVTPREEVQATLREGMAALEANDTTRVMALLDEKKSGLTRSLIQWGFSYATITGAKANSLKITVNELTSPPSAKAEFYAAISYKPKRPEVFGERWASRMTLDFEKQRDGRWLVTGHTEKGILGK